MAAAASNASEEADDPVTHAAGGPVVAATLSDRGTVRENNEDACGLHVAGDGSVLAIVADGVSGQEGGEVASQMAVEVTARAFRESPAAWGPLKRLYRAAQQANIEIYDRALVVTELAGMSTTLTAVVVEGGMLHAAHVGDSRLYLVRDRSIVQKTKDHTVAGGRARMGLGTRDKGHPDRSTLTRSLGRELIAAIDRISFPIVKGDAVVMCSDGLYNVLEDEELRDHVCQCDVSDVSEACRTMVRAANARGTPDNLTAVVLRITTDQPSTPPPSWRQMFGRLLRR